LANFHSHPSKFFSRHSLFLFSPTRSSRRLSSSRQQHAGAQGPPMAASPSLQRAPPPCCLLQHAETSGSPSSPTPWARAPPSSHGWRPDFSSSPWRPCNLPLPPRGQQWRGAPCFFLPQHGSKQPFPWPNSPPCRELSLAPSPSPAGACLLHGRRPAATPSSLHPPPPTPATNPPSPAGVLLLPAPSQGAQKIPQPSPQAAPSLLPWRSPVEAPCRHPLFLLSLPAPSPKQQVPAPPTSPMENNKPPPCPGVLAAQLGLASSLSGQPSRCPTARTTCSTICTISCVWSCWCSAQRLRDATDLRSPIRDVFHPR
jgi:hypothetical protein